MDIENEKLQHRIFFKKIYIRAKNINDSCCAEATERLKV